MFLPYKNQHHKRGLFPPRYASAAAGSAGAATQQQPSNLVAISLAIAESTTFALNTTTSSFADYSDDKGVSM